VKRRSFFLVVAAAVLVLALCACSKKVQGVSLDTQALTLGVGQGGILKAQVQPKSAANQEVAWAIDNAECATVGGDGALAAKALGTATVTVTTVDGGYTATCALTVVPGISMTTASLILSPGDTRTLKATVVPEKAAEAGLGWSSSDAKVAKVSANGVVKALALGTSTILAMALDGGRTAACHLTVAAPENGVFTGKNALTMDWGRARTLPDPLPEAANQRLKWASSNSTVATVGADGEIRAISPGRSTITVTSEDGAKKATYRLTVKPSNGEWLDLVDSKCSEVAAVLKQSRDRIGGLGQSQEGQAGAAAAHFVAAALETIGKMAEDYSVSVGKLLMSYRTGRKREVMEGLTDYHRVAASEMKSAAGGYLDVQANLVASGVPKSVVESVAKAFSAPAKTIEDEALPAIRLGQ